MVPVDKEYRFDGPDGEVTLPGLFDGRRQLITYRFFFDEDVSGWPDAGCEGCSMFTDGVTHLAHLHARDVTMVLLSPARRTSCGPMPSEWLERALVHDHR